MKRKIDEALRRWKTEENGRVALLLQGARGVGKTHAVIAFAQSAYETHLVIDFRKASPWVREVFDDCLDDLDRLFLNLEAAYPKARLLPRPSPDAPARTLIVLENVEHCPRAREAVKHLVADRRFDCLETGTSIAVPEHVKDILIPSEERTIDLRPLDFEEFLDAAGASALWEAVRASFAARRPLGALLHQRASDAFRRYLITGGMPQAVSCLAATNDLQAVDETKRRLLERWRDDLAENAGRRQAQALAVFDRIPAELMKRSKKFRLASLGDNAAMRNYSDAFFRLAEAGFVNCCRSAVEPSLGLQANLDRPAVKCFLADTGLLLSQSFDAETLVEERLHARILSGDLTFQNGLLIENAVAQMLRAAGRPLRFYAKASPAAQERMAIDFLLPNPTLEDWSRLSPVIVKTGPYTALSSLRKCLAKFPEHLATPYVLHDGDVKVGGRHRLSALLHGAASAVAVLCEKAPAQAKPSEGFL